MGYYTDFSLKIYNKSGGLETDEINCVEDAMEVIQYSEEYNKDVVRVMMKLNNNKKKYLCYGILSEEPCKWYEYEEEMISFSKNFPNLVFCLSGKGEEQGDAWKAYYYNGRVKNTKAEMKLLDIDIKEFVNGETNK